MIPEITISFCAIFVKNVTHPRALNQSMTGDQAATHGLVKSGQAEKLLLKVCHVILLTQPKTESYCHLTTFCLRITLQLVDKKLY